MTSEHINLGVTIGGFALTIITLIWNASRVAAKAETDVHGQVKVLETRLDAQVSRITALEAGQSTMVAASAARDERLARIEEKLDGLLDRLPGRSRKSGASRSSGG